MSAPELIDHSPNHPTKAQQLENAPNLILIDNYDSFTWNVYQYLVLEGATVTVVRNDELTLDELIACNPSQLVISPGPGHPDSDAGISNEAIRYFSGKIPILGVCMGQQCIITAFGGKVDVTGEILHGKTSVLKHDSKGVYRGLSSSIEVTRYHSLAGTHPTIPECLEISSWTELADGGDCRGIIMGVRHKEFTVEGVQFHPESILTENGRYMLRNFLSLPNGTWKGVEAAASPTKGAVHNSFPTERLNGSAQPAKKLSILEQIYAHRRSAVDLQKRVPSLRPEDLQAAYDLKLAPPLISFPDRLEKSPFPLSLMAEIKRASPSKGTIAANICAPVQARKYAIAGAGVISVLTEPEWFKGSIDDLRSVRQSLDGLVDRPAVLRKDFIFDEYQILEARLAGADTVLLIVKMLPTDLLTRLYKYSRSLGMEPLVEVNTSEEMETAINLGAKVIGVNNRDLTSFEVDLGTTGRLMDKVPGSTIVCALSGISSPEDIAAVQQSGAKAVLIGESLMKAQDIGAFVTRLLTGGNATRPAESKKQLLVKICGTRTLEAARAAIEAGADLVGIILAEGRTRTVSNELAKEISRVVKSTPRQSSHDQHDVPVSSSPSLKAVEYFDHTCEVLRHPTRALLVGVFFDQPLPFIISQQQKLDLDIVQLHGSEPIEWARFIPVPVLKKFSPRDVGISQRPYHALPLLDSGAGGSGELLSQSEVVNTLEEDAGLRIILAGGLDADNVIDTVRSLGKHSDKVVGVDVSSGVESNGKQDLEKIRAFLKAAKGI